MTTIKITKGMTAEARAHDFKALLDSYEVNEVSWIGNGEFDSFYWTAECNGRFCAVHVYEDRFEVEVEGLTEDDVKYADYKTALGAYKRAEKEAQRAYDYAKRQAILNGLSSTE